MHGHFRVLVNQGGLLIEVFWGETIKENPKADRFVKSLAREIHGGKGICLNAYLSIVGHQSRTSVGVGNIGG